jgi:hypothetical protein
MTDRTVPCIYCGKPADSIEHIFATWIIAEISSYLGQTLLQAELSDGQTSRTLHGARNKRGHPTLEFTTDQVCRKCNNEWMDRIDGKIRRYLPSLIRGGAYATNGKFCKAIAAWAVKTAITARFAHLTPTPVEREWTSQIQQSEVPSLEWRVWIAHYEGSVGLWYKDLDLNLEPGTWGDPAAPENALDLPRFDHGVLMTFVVGQFCVQVLRINGPAVPAIGGTDVSVQVWPPQTGAAWPPAKSLDDQSLVLFARRFNENGMHLLVRVPEERGTPDETQSTTFHFVSAPLTTGALASTDNHVVNVAWKCGSCGATVLIPHDTGTPLGQLQMPYVASVRFSCPQCEDAGFAEVTLNTAAGPSI